MKITCPACHAQFSLEAAVNLMGSRQALAAALQTPARVGKVMIQYLALFRPKSRALSLDRVGKLISELLPQIEAGHVIRNGLTRPAPAEVWREGMEHVLSLRDADRLTLPLKSHGYLLEVVAGLAEKAEAGREREREEQLRAPYRTDGWTDSEPELVSAAVWLSRALGDIDSDLRLGLIDEPTAKERRDQARQQAREKDRA